MRISDWSSDVCSSDLLVATVQQDYLSRSVDMTTAQIVPLSDWQAALADVRGVIADAIETPPSQADIDREANEIETFLQKELQNARNEPGTRLADDLVRAVDINETVQSPDRKSGEWGKRGEG